MRLSPIFILAAITLSAQGVLAQHREHSPIAYDAAARKLNIRTADDLASRRSVSALRTLSFPGSPRKLFIWNEYIGGRTQNFFAVSGNGIDLMKIGMSSGKVRLRSRTFDPIRETPKTTPTLGSAGYSDRSAYIVQFAAQPLNEMREQLRLAGAKSYIYLPDHAYIVQMNAESQDRVSRLPFVRWVGRYQPAFKLDDEVIRSLEKSKSTTARYSIMLLERGPRMQQALAERITAVGGTVHLAIANGFRVDATLTPEQLIDVAHSEDVLFIDRWSAPETDMDVVRAVSGANFIENTLGFTGQGVRGEVMDSGLLQTHTDVVSGLFPLIHNSPNTNEFPEFHGTSVYGIIFGRGTTNPTARGMLPEAQGIFADFDFLSDRYAHTAELNQAPFNAVFQSNSWGFTATPDYNNFSAELDDILFLNDILVLNSQANQGTQNSRPQAWAKNVVAVGGIFHLNTPETDDDRWFGGASIGPAADGRIKPDLAHFFDAIFTIEGTGDTNYTSFGGTSAATPITAGSFGIFYQMWHNGLFGNNTGATVFESRPHMTTAKAMMINTASQWDMTLPGTDITRASQGWGRADLQNLYALRNKMYIVDEAHPLGELAFREYRLTVPFGSTDPLKVTLVYADPMGNPAASVARINDLTLRVTAPDGATVYWGNNGLGTGGGMWSTPGGSANTVDTVENVFVQAPTPGVWRVWVEASELNADARLETPEMDADFALVVSGATLIEPTAAGTTVSGRVAVSGMPVRGAVLTLTGPDGIQRTAVTNTFGHYSFSDVPAGQTYLLTVSAAKYSFENGSISITPFDDLSGVDFIATE